MNADGVVVFVDSRDWATPTDGPSADYTFGTMIDPRVVYLCAPPVCIIPSTRAHWSDVRVARRAGGMQNEIVRKLNCQLERGFEREADVLYVMAEVRKLFEHVRTVRKFPVLAFYSNWALHSRIDREPWAKQGLKRLEEVVSGFNS